MTNEHDPGTFYPHQSGVPVQETHQIYLPRSVREQFEKLEAYWVDQFLSPEECTALVSLVREHGKRSTTSEGDVASISESRTSKSADLSALRDRFVDEIDMRICRYMGMNWTHGEGLQGQIYEVGEEFKPHFDFFTTGSTSLSEQGQRAWTFMVFLNDVEAGGQTTFPYLNCTYSPRAGSAIIWRNLDLAGNPNPYSFHCAEPVISGYKAILTKWFRQRGEGARFTKAAGEYLPAYSQNDMQKVRIPGALHRKIQDYVKHNEVAAIQEEGIEDFIKSQAGTPSQVIDLPTEIREEMHLALKPILEQWCGLPLKPSLVYGVRRYLPGATLVPHLDTYGTHIISATLNINQSLDKPWVLHVRDSLYRMHEVTLEPGEMLLYEGARLEHARLYPLEGEFYDSAFVHYYP